MTEFVRDRSSILTALAVALLGSACGSRPALDDTGDSSTTVGATTVGATTGTPPDPTPETSPTVDPVPDPDTGAGSTTAPGSTSSTGSTSAASTTDPSAGSSSDTGEPACRPDEPGCTREVDLVFVIDNSGTMGEEQRSLARSLPRLVEQVRDLTDARGAPRELDVHVMVTTTDMGNPLCTPFEPAGYDPARGRPVRTSCTERLADFTGLLGFPSIPEVCTDTCPQPVVPDDDFVAFDADGSNVAGAPADIDGDGVPESPAAQALGCIGPQGINGCGYESPLETMLQALSPAAEWNQGATPFLRDGATLGVVLVTDEADCSIQDFSIMENPAFQSVNPDTGMPGPSSAICWNAGVSCGAPDGTGAYADCSSQDAENLHPTTRYTQRLIEQLREEQGKEVFMLGIVGIPSVTARADEPPFQAVEGGVFDLVYRDWQDGEFPAGDILPEDFAAG